MGLTNGRVQQDVDHGGHHEGTRDTMGLYQMAKMFDLKARVHDHGARAQQHGHHERA